MDRFSGKVAVVTGCSVGIGAAIMKSLFNEDSSLPDVLEGKISSSNSKKSRFFSTLLSRRYVSPCPPQPPPRRLSESSSVPGSPQHYNFRRNDLIRNTPAPTKFQYTPQPQRKTIYQINDL